MKPIKFITTFSQVGYELYGKTWIDTFTKSVKEAHITADIYVDFPLKINNSKINIVNYDKAIPMHRSWIENFNNSFDKFIYNKKMAVRFSYKAFVMQHALDNNKDCYVIWLDGDCIFKQSTYNNFVEKLLDSNAIACQREINGGFDHIESGIIIFDADHPDIKAFNKKFKSLYEVENLIKFDSPYDGFMVYQSLSQTKTSYTDLNEFFGTGGIQSDPSQTFLHPEINSRFHHNIGLTGKSQYSMWRVLNKSDDYFQLVQHGGTKITQKDIHKIRNLLLDKRNSLERRSN